MLAPEEHSFHDGRLQRICLNLVEDDIFGVPKFQFFFEFVETAVRLGGFAIGNDNERLFAEELLLMKFCELAGPEQDFGGNVPSKAHDACSFRFEQ